MFLLSDGYLANGSEPWRCPTSTTCRTCGRVRHRAQRRRTDEFLPYLRDPETLARPWAVPGTPGLEHRIGGLEKADKTGDISYDPANHDFMVRTRAAKIDGIAACPTLEVDDPDGAARVLVLGWGSTYGPIGAACRGACASAACRSPRPTCATSTRCRRNLGEVLARYDKVVIPEMNLGQLAHADPGAATWSTRSPTTRSAGCRSRPPSWPTMLRGRDQECLIRDGQLEAHGQGLQDRPGGPLVPRLR